MPQVLCSVLVGRDNELTQLVEELQAARIGNGGVVVLSGEAGIGKSRLAQALVQRALGGGVPAVTGRAVEGSSLAFRPFGEAINALTRGQGPPKDRDLEPFHVVLSSFVSAWASEAAAVAQPGLVVLEGLHRLVRAIASSHGLLVVLEDLQWADADTLAALEYLADNITAERLLLVCTERSGVSGVPADLRRPGFPAASMWAM